MTSATMGLIYVCRKLSGQTQETFAALRMQVLIEKMITRKIVKWKHKNLREREEQDKFRSERSKINDKP